MGKKQPAARSSRSGRSIEEHGGASTAPGHSPRLMSHPPGIPQPGMPPPWAVPLPVRGSYPFIPNEHYAPRRSSKRSSKDKPKNGHMAPVYRIPVPMGPPHPIMLARGGPPLIYPMPPPHMMYGPPPGMGYPGGPSLFGYPRFWGPGAPDMGPNDTSSKRSSVVVATFPDPKDDQIIRDENSKSRQSPNRTSNHVDIIVTTAEVNNNDDKGDVEDRNRTLARVAGGQTIVPDSSRKTFLEPNGNASMLPSHQRETHFVTYIKDDPIPLPPSTHEEEQETLVTERKKPPPQIVYTKLQEGFVEVGEAEGNVVRHLIDAGGSQQTMFLPGERVPLSVHRVPNLDAGHEEQTATLTFTDLDKSDVVICYDSLGVGLATVLKDELQDCQLTVWMGSVSAEDTSKEEFNNTARAVFNTKALVVLLSTTSAENRRVRDLVSLATLTHRPVFPAALGSGSSTVQLLGIELKLQLSRCKWTELSLSGGVYIGAGLGDLVTSIKEQTNALRKYEVIDEDYGQVSSWAVRHQRAMRLEREKDGVKIVSRLEGDGSSPPGVGQTNNGPGQGNFVMTASEFWDKTFPQNNAVPYDKFRAQLRSHYLSQFANHLPRSCMDRLMKALRESLVLKDTKGTEYTRRDIFIAFCTDNGFEKDVWHVICDVAKHYQAVIDIFDKDSTIRMVALEGIASYGSPAVVSGLRELVQDGDPQIRCLAVEALSRCMLRGDQISVTSMMAALDDAHWMVRKAACEGMARLGAVQAVDRLRRLGRTDMNAHVRAASASALAEIEAGIPRTTAKAPV